MSWDLNLSELFIYLDDILVFSPTVEEHIDRLDRVLTRLADYQGEKCDLFRNQVKYLGHAVGSEGIAVDDDKIQRIRDWPVPRTAVHLRSFLGGVLPSFCTGFFQGSSSFARSGAITG